MEQLGTNATFCGTFASGGLTKKKKLVGSKPSQGEAGTACLAQLDAYPSAPLLLRTTKHTINAYGVLGIPQRGTPPPDITGYGRSLRVRAFS